MRDLGMNQKQQSKETEKLVPMKEKLQKGLYNPTLSKESSGKKSYGLFT